MENEEEKMGQVETEQEELKQEKKIKIEEKKKEIIQKIKKWDWKTFLKVHIRNFLILLVIFYVVYLMMNVFLETDRITKSFQSGEYLGEIEESSLTEQQKEEMRKNLLKIIFGYWITDRNGFFTIAIYFAVFCILKSFVGKSKTACLILVITELIYEIINYIVTNLRGSGVTIADVYSIQTAINVAQGIRPQFDGYFVAGLFLFIIALLLILGLEIKEKKIKIWQRISLFCLGCVVIVTIANSEYLEEISIWNINQTYQWHGTPLAIVKMLSDIRVEKPAGYNEQEVKTLLESKQQEENGGILNEEEWPNIIVVMNESFSDLYQTAEIGKQDPIPYFRRLIQRENVISGIMYSSEIGGKTANVEYEFLTQNTTAFLPVGAVPYQQYSQKERENLAQTLKNLGYQTSAIHSWYKSGYTRSKIYPLFGFEKVAFYEDLPNLEASFNEEHPTDLSTYQEVIKQLEEKEEGTKLFNFTVTMQNHIPYTTENEEQINYSDDPEINCYLQLIHQSDEALTYFIEELEKQDEKVILLFFGDHQPKLQNVESDLSSIKTYEIPYFIWANYEIETQQGKDISTNYLQSLLMEVAGLPKTNYTNYILELQQTIPVITKQFYQDSTGTIYDLTDTSSPDYAKIEEYKKVVYYQMFHK